MREIVAEQTPSASVWKASEYRLVGDPLAPDFIQATPDAVWARTDPFRTYRPVGDRGVWNESPAHTVFWKLADAAHESNPLESHPTNKETKVFSRAVKLFADRYGLLGLFLEEFGTPLLPEREVGISIHVAPDTVIDREGRLHWIDPATDGKWLVEKKMEHFDEVWAALRGQPPPNPTDYILEADELIMPHELRFQRPTADFVRSGISRLLPDRDYGRIFTYAEAKRRYGLRVVYDRDDLAATGAFLISTREPLSMWRDKLSAFTGPLYQGFVNRQLEGVSPLLVLGKDGEVTGSWSCPSLLKAIHLMRYLDFVSKVKVQRCRAPGCGNYFRVGPRSRESLYCPPPPGKKQSRCASRASSAMYRERQRRKS